MKQYEYKFLSRAIIEHGSLPLDDILNRLALEGWRVKSAGTGQSAWQFLLQRRVRDVVQFVDPVKQKQVVNPQLISFSEAVCRMYDGQWFQSLVNPRAAYGLVNGELMYYRELKTPVTALSECSKAEITLDLVTARWYQVQKPRT